MRKPLGRECCVDECESPVTKAGGFDMCCMHYQRVRKHGSPDVVGKGGCRMVGPDNPNWSGSAASYSAVHLRLANQRGPARDLLCVDCSGAAAHWSYDNSDPDERRDPTMGRYSADLTRYVPRCVPCHSAFDRAQRALLTGERP